MSRWSRRAGKASLPPMTALRLSALALCVIAGMGGYESLTSYNRVESAAGYGRIEGHMAILGPGGLRDQAVELSTKFALYAAKRDHGLLDLPPPGDRVYCAGHEWADAVGVICEPAPPLTIIPVSREEREAFEALRAGMVHPAEYVEFGDDLAKAPPLLAELPDIDQVAGSMGIRRQPAAAPASASEGYAYAPA